MKILPVFLPLQGCPYNCVYCDQKAITKTLNIDLQSIKEQINNFCLHNKNDYKEIAFYGGTFTNLSDDYIDQLLSLTDPYIEENVSIRISTRPDHIFQDQLQKLSQRGLKTVELGVQSFSDKVLRLSGRNYSSETAAEACRTVKACNMILGVQLMPGLPGSNDQTVHESTLRTLQIKPDLVRIYPTVVLKNTALEKLYTSGKYTPLTLQQAIDHTADMIILFEKEQIKVIKAGLHSDINPENIVAGPYHQSFGELVRIEIMLKKSLQIINRERLFVISKYDVSLFRGFKQKLLKRIKSKLGLENIPVNITDLQKGEITFTDQQAKSIW